MDLHRLIIVDGYSLLYRAFYSTRMLSTTDGRPTNALFGFTSMIFSLIEQQQPVGVLVALDAPGKTFRHAEYAEYKGTRREMPPELQVQMPVARELISALGIPQLEVTGYEGDDVIGTIAKRAERNGYCTSIISGDLDSLQLVDDSITVVTPKVGVTEVAVYDRAKVIERYGFGPEFITDYKALVGDTSDNIPGVPGIGEKSASKLILQFGTVESIVARLPEVEEKFRKKIEPHVDQLHKSKWLATINTEAPVEYDFTPLHLTIEQYEAGLRWLENLEFKSLMRRAPAILGLYVPDLAGTLPATAAVATEALEAKSLGELPPDALRSWLGERPFSLYFNQGPSMNMFEEGVVTAYVAAGHEVAQTTAEFARALFLENPARAAAHDAKHLYLADPQATTAPRFDSMLAGYVLQSGRSHYALGDLAQGYLEVAMPTTPEQLAVSVGLLEPVMRDRLGKEGQTSVLDEIELPLVPVLAGMERLGIRVDPNFLREYSKMLEAQIQSIARNIFDLAGQEFVIGSPKQLGEILFDKLQLPGAKKTKTGYATGAEVLTQYTLEYPIVQEVLNWRELTKLKSTYSDSLPKMVAADGRIHTTFNQTVAATGRLSSIDPNLQNIPIRTELGRQIRRAFVAEPGLVLASFDYSQIELRLLAHLCEDENLVRAFNEYEDVHTATAALMFRIERDQVTKDQRRLAKMLNYAVLYGVTEFGLAQQLGGGFSISEAKALIQQYNERFPRIKRFTEEVVEEARHKGFTTTLRGRRRYFPDIHAANRNERMGAERQAMNAPIQGAAADMIKLAMIQVHRDLGGSATRMLLQVHDELVFEMGDDRSEWIEPIRHTMARALPLSVPVEVDAKIGANWEEMAEVPVPR